MKKLFKSPLLWVLVGEVIVMAVLTVVGFVFYNPDIEGSWAIVSAFAAWAGVISSTVAIFVAIQIPKKIAERQDKIALFEKRYDFYVTLCNCLGFARVYQIKQYNNEEQLLQYFIPDISSDTTSGFEVQKFLKKISATMQQGVFLFEFDCDEVTNLSSCLIDLFQTYSKENLDKYVDQSEKIITQILPQIEKTLALKSK